VKDHPVRLSREYVALVWTRQACFVKNFTSVESRFTPPSEVEIGWLKIRLLPEEPSPGVVIDRLAQAVAFALRRDGHQQGIPFIR
jgi:hypothetical protein